jgi:hypothetical protein
MHWVRYNVASQTLRHEPPERVTSATYVIEDLTKTVDQPSDRTVASGTASYSSIATTTDAAAGAGQASADRVPVASTADATVGDPCVIVGSDGRWERFRIAAIESGAAFIADNDLLGSYSSGAEVFGTALDASFPDAEAADEDNINSQRPFRIVWTYTVRGEVHTVQEQIRITRDRMGEAPIAKAIDLMRAAYPSLVRQQRNPKELERLVWYAYEDLRARMLAKGQRPQELLIGEQAAHILMLRAVLLMAENGADPGHLGQQGVSFLEVASSNFGRAWAGLTVGYAGEATADVDRIDGTAHGPRSTKHRHPLLGL